MKLETERLILRDFVADDWQRVLEYQSNPLYLRYNHWEERTPQAVKEFIGRFLDHQQQEPRIKYQLAVILKSNHLLIGNCGGLQGSPFTLRLIPDPVSSAFGRKLQIVPKVFRQVEVFYVTIDEQSRGNAPFRKIFEATSCDGTTGIVP